MRLIGRRLMHVLSFPDSSSSRVHISIIRALDEMKDVPTISNLLAVEGAAHTFWREANSRNTQAGAIGINLAMARVISGQYRLA